MPKASYPPELFLVILETFLVAKLYVTVGQGDIALTIVTGFLPGQRFVLSTTGSSCHTILDVVFLAVAGGHQKAIHVLADSRIFLPVLGKSPEIILEGLLVGRRLLLLIGVDLVILENLLQPHFCLRVRRHRPRLRGGRTADQSNDQNRPQCRHAYDFADYPSPAPAIFGTALFAAVT